MKLAKQLFVVTTALLAMAGLYIVGERLWQASSQFETILTSSLLLALTVGSVVYGASVLLLAYGWALVLSKLMGKHVPLAQASFVYAVSGLGKYLPGNVLHILGRQGFAGRFGWGQGSTLKATLVELVFVTGIPLTVYVLVAENIGLPLIARVLIVLAAVAASAVLYLRLAKQPSRGEGYLDKLFSTARVMGMRTPVVSGAMVLLFFVLGATVAGFLTIEIYQANPSTRIFLAAGAAYLAAFAVGILSPGAPAGLGVREGAFVLLMTPYIGATDAAFVAVASRVVTMAGDLIFVAGATAIYGLRPDPAG